MKYLLLVVGISAATTPMPAGMLRASWGAGKVVVASFQLKPEAAKQIAVLLTACSPSEVRFELELRQNRRYWPDSVVARTLVRNNVRCEADSFRNLTRVIDGVVVERKTTPDLDEVLSFVSSTGVFSAFPGLTNSASLLSYSITLNSTVLSNNREGLSALRLAQTALSPRDE